MMSNYTSVIECLISLNWTGMHLGIRAVPLWTNSVESYLVQNVYPLTTALGEISGVYWNSDAIIQHV